jgi:hypothetical protein
MRRILVIAWWLAGMAPANAEPFADFRIPDHTTRSGRVHLGVTSTWRAGGTNEYESRETYSRFGTGADYSWLRDADDLQLRLDGSIDASAGRDDSQGRQILGAGRQNWSSRRRNRGEVIRWSTSVRVYPWEQPWGIEFGGGGSFDFDHTSWHEHRITRDFATSILRSTSIDHHTSRRRQRSVQLVVAPGWGRVRDASAVYAVHVLEERLQSAGVLSRPPSTGAATALASLFHVRDGFSAPHQRPDRFFWREVERILVEDGALDGGGLDALAAFYLQEAIQPGFAFEVLRWQINDQRLRGWFIGGVVEAAHGSLTFQDEQTSIYTLVGPDSTTTQTTATTFRRTRSDDRYFAGAKLEAHAPLGWRWQVGARSQILAPLRSQEDGFKTQSAALASWRIADRWSWNAGGSHERIFLESEDPQPWSRVWEVRLGTSLSYFLEDRILLQANLEQLQIRERYRTPGHRYVRDGLFFVGATYRFSGALDAPGLMTPQRLLH